MSNMEKQWLTIDEVAEALRVNPATIARLVKRGEFPRPRMVGVQQRWPASCVEPPKDAEGGAK